MVGRVLFCGGEHISGISGSLKPSASRLCVSCVCVC